MLYTSQNLKKYWIENKTNILYAYAYLYIFVYSNVYINV